MGRMIGPVCDGCDGYESGQHQSGQTPRASGGGGGEPRHDSRTAPARHPSGQPVDAVVAAPRAVPAHPADARRVDLHDDDHAAATRAGDEDRSARRCRRAPCCTPPRPRRRPNASRRRRSRSRCGASCSTPATAARIPAPRRRSCSRRRSRSTSDGVCGRCSSSDGFEVVVTRDADRTIALRERARLANDSQQRHLPLHPRQRARPSTPRRAASRRTTSARRTIRS